MSTINASGTGLTYTSDATGTLLIQTNGTTAMTVDGSQNVSTVGPTNLSPANSNITISPTGTGTVTINPNTAGNINNMSIGASTSAAGTFTTATVNRFVRSGNVTASAWGATGVLHQSSGAATLTDTSSSGTLAINSINTFNQHTLASSNSVTVTDAATVYIAGGPQNGTNTTITNSNALYVASGISRLLGAVTINGSNVSTTISPTGTGTVTINPATVGTINNMSIGATTASTGRFTTLAVKDTSANFDVTITPTSSIPLSGSRTLTLDVVDNARSIKLAGNIDISSNVTFSGAFAFTGTLTNTTSITFPTSGTLYSTATASITSSQLATSLSDETGSGSLVFGTNPTLASPAYGNATSTTDADATVDASTTNFYSYVQSASTTTRTINISNLTAGRVIMLYLRNTNAGTKAINITASTTAAGFAAVNLSIGGSGTLAVGQPSATLVTLAATSGTAMVMVFNAGGVFGGSIS